MNLIKEQYNRLYKFCIGDNPREQDPRATHIHLLATITTSVLMWSYAFTAIYTIPSPIPGIVGIICSVIHMFSPIMFRFGANAFWAGFVVLTAGYIHQGTFAFFTGGFTSNVLIWFGIIPMLAGVIAGLGLALTTGIITSIVATTFFFMDYFGFQFPNEISQSGWFLSQGMLVFGWVGLSTIMIYNFIAQNGVYEKELCVQKDKVQNLLQILLHDISNRVQSIELANYHANLSESVEEKVESLKNVSAHIRNLNNMLHSVRRMHVLELEKKKLNLSPVNLKKVVSSSTQQLSRQLKSKQIEIITDGLNQEVLSDFDILENQVIFNILSNCAKFSTPQSQIMISSNLNASSSMVEVNIRDYGVGMPSRILENLFNPNYETTRPGTENEKGTGIGLIIAKSMIERMGGSINVNSRSDGNDKGTTFALKLPVA